jgi:hypothetical protein
MVRLGVWIVLLVSTKIRQAKRHAKFARPVKEARLLEPHRSFASHVRKATSRQLVQVCVRIVSLASTKAVVMEQLALIVLSVDILRSETLRAPHVVRDSFPLQCVGKIPMCV